MEQLHAFNDMVKVMRMTFIFSVKFVKKSKFQNIWYLTRSFGFNLIGFFALGGTEAGWSIVYGITLYTHIYFVVTWIIELQFDLQNQLKLFPIFQSIERFNNFLKIQFQTKLNFSKLILGLRVCASINVLGFFTIFTVDAILKYFYDDENLQEKSRYFVAILFFYFYYIWSNLGVIFFASILTVKAYQILCFRKIRFSRKFFRNFSKLQFEWYQSTKNLIDIFSMLTLSNCAATFINMILCFFLWFINSIKSNNIFLFIWIGLLSLLVLGLVLEAGEYITCQVSTSGLFIVVICLDKELNLLEK